MRQNRTPPDRLELERRPEARAESAESLIQRALSGAIRIPFFQRGLKWQARDVVTLLDSIRKGLPIGSLLFWKKAAPANKVVIGKVTIDAPEIHDAWWVADGQQRLTALTASLARPLPIPRFPEDPYVVYFDPRENSFHSPPASGEIGPTWVAVPNLLDAAQLSEFVIEWEFHERKEWRSTLFEAGKRLREYQIPVYIVETDNEDVLREIFFRVNKSGRPLTWPEVHDALYGSDASLTTIEGLDTQIAESGMGHIEKSAVPTILLAMRGKDVTRPLDEHVQKDPDVLTGAVEQASLVLPLVLNFLRFKALIPHLRLLPRSYILEILARFYALHPSPHPRSETLLCRWLWRLFLGKARFEERTLRRRALSFIGADEEVTVQKLLQDAPSMPEAMDVEANFDSRSARTRVIMLALSSKEPRDLCSGEQIDIQQLLESHHNESFQRLLPGNRSTANVYMHPPMKNASTYLRALISEYQSGEILASHAISSAAASAFLGGDKVQFIRLRSIQIRHILEELGQTLASWNAPDRDRPSLEHLMKISED